MSYTLSVLSELEFRTGNLAAALAAASEAVSIATETGQRGTAAYALVTLARAEAAAGREQATREHADQALKLAEQAGTLSITTYARAALGLLELGLARPERAREQLAPLPELTLGHGLGEPGVVCWQPDWIEANIRLGDLGQAEQALTRLEREASSVNRTWAPAASSCSFRMRHSLRSRSSRSRRSASARSLAARRSASARSRSARASVSLRSRLVLTTVYQRMAKVAAASATVPIAVQFHETPPAAARTTLASIHRHPPSAGSKSKWSGIVKPGGIHAVPNIWIQPGEIRGVSPPSVSPGWHSR